MNDAAREKQNLSILVAYASRHGATRQIAERIAEKLKEAGYTAEAQQVEPKIRVDRYDAFVIGSAAYFGHWMKEATEFLRRNRTLLSGRPVWLFSSGPLGEEPVDAQGQDLRAASEPKEFTELGEEIQPRGRRVFFGALDPGRLGFRERMVRSLPAGRALMPEGDFRDWQDIDSWAESIARELEGAPASTEEESP
jgi:menaquinone-dependent protoporphyrinogen oxidase